ncbi:MAG: hypothetical protein LIP23_00420, partial [Planctomycetes bacterium]|nr:hypothetical protein [Planctomycetota bacterium]
ILTRCRQMHASSKYSHSLNSFGAAEAAGAGLYNVSSNVSLWWRGNWWRLLPSAVQHPLIRERAV